MCGKALLISAWWAGIMVCNAQPTTYQNCIGAAPRHPPTGMRAPHSVQHPQQQAPVPSAGSVAPASAGEAGDAAPQHDGVGQDSGTRYDVLEPAGASDELLPLQAYDAEVAAAGPEEAQAPVEPLEEQAPAGQQQVQAPVLPQQEEAPVEPQGEQAPAEQQQIQAPVSPQQEEAPVEPQQVQAPVVQAETVAPQSQAAESYVSDGQAAVEPTPAPSQQAAGGPPLVPKTDNIASNYVNPYACFSHGFRYMIKKVVGQGFDNITTEIECAKKCMDVYGTDCYMFNVIKKEPRLGYAACTVTRPCHEGDGDNCVSWRPTLKGNTHDTTRVACFHHKVDSCLAEDHHHNVKPNWGVCVNENFEKAERRR